MYGSPLNTTRGTAFDPLHTCPVERSPPMTSRHFVPAFAIAASILIAGCETSEIARVGEEPREAISYAATASYPGEATQSSDLQLAAIDNPDAREIELLNLTDNSIPASTLWVNGAFVKRIPS